MIIMKRAFLWKVFTTVLLFHASIFAQSFSASGIISEAPIEMVDGIRNSNLITVKFKKEVIKRKSDVLSFSLGKVDNRYKSVRLLFENVEQQYGSFYFRPRFKRAVWGDTLFTNELGEKVIRPDVSQVFAVKFSTMVPIDLITEQLNKLPIVEYAHGPIQTRPLNSPVFPNDLLFNTTDQWGIINQRLPEAWEITKGSENVVAGFIEQGGIADKNHPDLSTEFELGTGDTGGSKAHATHVAGIIGAATDNSTGIASVGWKTKLATYSFSSFDGASNGDLVAAIEQAVDDGVKIVNLSFVVVNTGITAWVCPDTTGCKSYGSFDYGVVKDAIFDAFINDDVIFVSGSGNTGIEVTNDVLKCGIPECWPNIPNYIPYPAAYDTWVIGVSAIDVNNNFGQNPLFNGIDYNIDIFPQKDFITVTAPGINILSTSSSSGYTYASGTSFSGPFVTGVIALMKSVHPDLSFSGAKNQLTATAVDLNDPSKFGAGRVDVYEALKQVFQIRITSDITQNTTWGTDDFALFRGPSSPSNIYVDGATLTIDAGATVVIESGIRVEAINGGSIICNPGSKIILESGAEIIAGSGCTVTDAGATIIFKGAGSCMATNGGTLKFSSGVDRVVENGGLVASFNSNGVIEVDDDATITIQFSSLLELDPGTTIKLGEDAAIDIYGGIDAVGTSGSPIVFESKYTSPPINQYWDGIYVDNPSESSDSSRIHYVTIKNASWGVFANNGALSIENSTIEDCHLYGIRLENSHSTIKNTSIDNTTGIAGMYIRYSDPLLDGNSITDSNLDGIYLYQADPDLFNCDIKENGRYGVYTYNYSSPSFGSNTTTTGGYNVISDNQYGIYSYYYSTPFLGDEVIQFPNVIQVGGENSLYSNSTREIKAIGYSDVLAQYNWWGQSPPSIASFESDGTSSIDFNNNLTADPNLSMLKGAGKSTTSTNSPENLLNPDDPRSLLKEARSLARQGEIRPAIQKYRYLIGEHPSHKTAKWATTELDRALHKISSDSSFQYLKGIVQRTANADLKRIASDRLTKWYVRDNDHSQSIANAERITQTFPVSESEKHALFDLVNIYLFTMKDRSNAQLAFLQLKAKYPLDELTNSAELFFDTGRELKTSPGVQGILGKNKLLTPTTIPTEFALEQNYPNPFNPSTTIQFNLPKEAAAKLSIFNINGQHIATLVDTQLEAGQHEYEWDGKDAKGVLVASGTYVYLLKAGGKQIAKQMTLIR